MNKRWLAVLQHALNDRHGSGRGGRDHFYCSLTGDDFKACTEMMSAGLMRDCGEYPFSPLSPLWLFCVTPDGVAYVREHCPEPKCTLTRSQKRYRAFLRSDGGMKFGEWLKAFSGRFYAR